MYKRRFVLEIDSNLLSNRQNPQYIGNYYKREGFTIRVLDERVINGTNNKNALLNSEIYPNPSTGLFNIKIEAQNNEEAQIRVTNQLGQLVHSENRTALKGINSLSIDLNNQENGVYFISLQLGYRSANYIVLIAK